MLIYELNWRLETAMVPLFTSWAEQMQAVVAAYSPFPESHNESDASARLDAEQGASLDWKTIGECWVSLAFAFAREAREDQDRDRFRHWMNQLQPLLDRRPDWAARWHHEESLFRLSQFNEPGVREILDRWPATPDQPFWQVKRAAMLAELGELSEAERLAEEALTRIRARSVPFSVDYRLLSQEGWTMLTLREIKQSRTLSRSASTYGNYRDRWEKLAGFRCNPLLEIETLATILSAPAPRPLPVMQQTREFDPGRITLTHRFSSEWPFQSLMPAYAFLRLYDQGGVPVRCGYTALFPEALQSAVNWVSATFPAWALTFLLRLGQEKAIDAWFSRTRVALLTEDQVNYLAEMLINALRQSIDVAQSQAAEVQLSQTNLSVRLARLLPELLSRLCFRFGEADLARLFDLASLVYHHPLYRRHRMFAKSAREILSRLLDAMEQPMLLARMPALLSLPIPAVNGFEVEWSDDWPEPFPDLAWLQGTRLSPTFDRSSWTSPIQFLLNLAQHGVSDASWRAINRLDELSSIQGLNSEEKAAFAEALWSRTDAITGLPADTRLLSFVFLTLPEPESGKAEATVRQYLLKGDFPRRPQRTVAEDGRKVVTISGGGDNDFPTTWINSTVSIFGNPGQREARVDWSADEANGLRHKLVDWWDTQKQGLADGNFFVEWLRQDLLMAFPLLTDVIIPRLPQSDEGAWQAIDRLVAEMQGAGFIVIGVLPALLIGKLVNADEAASRLRLALNSMREDEVRGAVQGVFYWLGYHAKNLVPAPPADLLEDIINHTLTRRQPGLQAALQYLASIVHMLPEAVTNQQRNRLHNALDYLAAETALPLQEDMRDPECTHTAIPVDERPEYRASAAALAYELYSQIPEGQPVSAPLQRWREIASSDSLPEVRWAWRRRILS